MTRALKFIYSNKLFCFLMILVQFSILFVVTWWLDDYSRYLYVLMIALGVLLILYEINRDEEPGFKLTWVLLIAVLPIFGALLYLFLHYNFISNRISKRSAEIREDTAKYTKQDPDVLEAMESERTEERGISRYIYTHSGLPVYKDCRVDYFPLGDDMFKSLIPDLKKAESFIFIEKFIINPSGKMWPEILEILKEKAASGVEVRLMYDGMGCVNLLPNDYPKTMKSYGIDCRVFARIVPFFSTYQNNRDHRKLVIIDGKVGYTGGINFADEYINEVVRFGHWKDTAVRVCGTAVASMTSMFLRMWNVADKKRRDDEDYGKYITASENLRFDEPGYVIPFADSPLDNDRFGETMYINNLSMAQDYVHIMTPYLVIGTAMLTALKSAAKRGVDVKLILPHIPDKPYAFYLAGTYYKELIENGVEIYEYTPGFVHAKMSVSDDKRAIIGTINHDYRSLYLHYENAVYMAGTSAVSDMERDYEETLKLCERITLDVFKKRNVLSRVAGRIIRLVAPLL